MRTPTLLLSTVAGWLLLAAPALADREITRALTPGELKVSLAVMGSVVLVVVLLCLRTWTYQLQLDDDRLLLYHQGEITHKIQLDAFARVKVGRKGKKTLLVDKDGSKYYTAEPLTPAMVAALRTAGVAIEGLPGAV